MFGVGFPEWGFLAFVPLLFWALVLTGLYWTVRMAVRHGLLDARRRQLPPGSGAPPTNGV
ncbi:hypothetical protein SAMN06264364_10833 [Quadrisphaera granulorum]|uniref:Uncharacterized protein n=1 Tax=Quadrisphaera granulorum TaxID=317664 RepID=A0A316A876_9ACTN|nr:hypothetical protein [Quadrisphaera granulorum]PWJ54126.1 hypothetical protein BXY45_10833 [Quadrisphaera granulorum]SZE96265.1 hypothetical protein SAMN06264364_10833 [Quadrisphaera granulorum]